MTQPQNPVWEQLREQMNLLRSSTHQTTDAHSLAQRLAARAQTLRQRMERPASSENRVTFLAFNKQQERYGIPLDEVAAVESLEHFTPVPGAADFVRGVTPWRGSVLSLIDLGRFFGRTETGIADLRACVIVETAGKRLAIVAHEVEEIITVEESELARTLDLPAGMAPEWVIGVHDENRLILKMSEVIDGILRSQRSIAKSK